MADNVILLAIILGPVAVMTLLRVNAVMVYLSLCLGQVMVLFVAGNANSLLTWIAPNMSPVGTSLTKIGVLLLPVVFTIVTMLFSVHGHFKAMINIIPAVAAGVLGALLAVPLLPPGLRHSIESLALWSQLAKLQALIIGLSALAIMFFMWRQGRASGHTGHH